MVYYLYLYFYICSYKSLSTCTCTSVHVYICIYLELKRCSMNVYCLLPCCINQLNNDFNQYLLSVSCQHCAGFWRWRNGDGDPDTALEKLKREMDIQTPWFQISHGFRELAETAGFRHCQLVALGADVMTCHWIMSLPLHKHTEETCYKDRSYSSFH